MTSSSYTPTGSSAHQPRSALASFGWTIRDYAQRVWDNSGEDNVLFLAGGIAFNLMLAAAPFVLLLATGVTYILPLVIHAPDMTPAQIVFDFIDRMLPDRQGDPTLDRLIGGLLNRRGTLTWYGVIGFVWFSTRLFGSLRTVLASVFDIESERGIIAGKIFDVKITIVSTLLFVASVTVSTYLTLATRTGTMALVTIGLRNEVMGRVEYLIGRGIAFTFIGLMFFGLYKYLPVRRVRTSAAFVAAAFTGVAFELARIVFSYYIVTFNPGSLYSGALTAVIILIVWFYYAALIFILGGEVGQVYELRRVRRLQREVFTD